MIGVILAGIVGVESMSESAGGQRRNWRYREKRMSTKLLAKRVSQEDHDLVVAYAMSLHVTVADLLAPAVKDLINRASAYSGMATVDSAEHGTHERDAQ
jgi:hypothetical protein